METRSKLDLLLNYPPMTDTNFQLIFIISKSIQLLLEDIIRDLLLEILAIDTPCLRYWLASHRIFKLKLLSNYSIESINISARVRSY